MNRFNHTLQKNTQLKHQSIRCSWATVNFLSDFRPDPESLKLTHLNFYTERNMNDTYRFNNMKIFKIANFPVHGVRLPLEFGNRVDLSWTYRIHK